MATPMSTPGERGADLERIDALVGRYLTEREVRHERLDAGRWFVSLPGEHKLATSALIVAGEHALLVEAFVIRRPDEGHAEFYRYLLRRNARAYGVAFALDRVGDVYLVGRRPLEGVTEDELDRLLGAVLEYADSAFDDLLRLGFATAIRREWAWRVTRGESLDNLRRFEAFVQATQDGAER